MKPEDRAQLAPWTRAAHWSAAEASALLAGFVPVTYAIDDYATDDRGVPEWLPEEHRPAYLSALRWFATGWDRWLKQHPREPALTPWKVIDAALCNEVDFPGLEDLATTYKALNLLPSLDSRLDFDLWRSRPLWTADQAAYILAGLEPHDDHSATEKPKTGRPSWNSPMMTEQRAFRRQLMETAALNDIQPVTCEADTTVLNYGGSRLQGDWLKKFDTELRCSFRQSDIIKWARRRQENSHKPIAHPRIVAQSLPSVAALRGGIQELAPDDRDKLQIQMLGDLWAEQTNGNHSEIVRRVEAIESALGRAEGQRKACSLLARGSSDTKIRSALREIDTRPDGSKPGPKSRNP